MIHTTYNDDYNGERRFTATTVRHFQLNEDGTFQYRHVKLFDYPDNEHDAFIMDTGSAKVSSDYARDEYKAFAVWDNPNDYGWDNY